MASSPDFPRSNTFEPTTFKLLATVFDEIWADLSASLEGQSQATVENVRSKLGHAVLVQANCRDRGDVLTMKSHVLKSLARLYPQLRF